MALLAERKSKEKWSQDPRNTHWSNDKSKFGYRMLERMGWSETQGLGKDGDGCTEHVKVTRKRDNAGVGAKKGRDEDWIQHQDAFDELLAGLNKGREETTTTNKSIVESAGYSKRITYKRFLQSKDLSVASSEELDCVLGRKRRKKSKHKDNKKLKTVEESSEHSDKEVTSHGITTITRTQSVKDYFSSKMSKLKKQ